MQLPLVFQRSAKITSTTDIIGLFLGTRLLLILGGFFCFILFPVPAHIYPQTPVNGTALLASWNHWDATRYIRIAQHGYQQVADTAFFPLFPLLTRAIATLFGHHAYALAAMLVSNLAFLAALFLLYHIACDVQDEQLGRRTLLYLCLFPTAFFFFVGYNEALFLLLSCGSLFAMRWQRWLLAGILGLLAALTRSAGALLIFPYLYELWRSRTISFGWSPGPPGQTRRHLHDTERASAGGTWLPGLLFIPLGTLLYASYCWLRFGDPLAFASVQKFWGRVFTFPWMGILGSFSQILRRQPFGSFLDVHILLDLSATLGFIGLAALSWRYLRASYALWISLLMLYTLCSSAMAVPDHLVSNQRFVLEMFPGFLVLAMLSLRHSRLHLAVMISFPFFQAILAALFLLNHWMV